MGKTGSFIHTSAHTLSLPITNAFVAANRHSIDLNDELLVLGSAQGNRFRGRLSSIWIHVTTIGGGATGLIFSLSKDAGGDNKFIGNTTATFSLGVTTATEGNVTAKLDVDYVSTNSDVLFLHARTDIGTCTITRIDLIWEE